MYASRNDELVLHVSLQTLPYVPSAVARDAKTQTRKHRKRVIQELLLSYLCPSEIFTVSLSCLIPSGGNKASIVVVLAPIACALNNISLSTLDYSIPCFYDLKQLCVFLEPD